MLPMLFVRDARTGKYVSKGEKVEYSKTDWWSWHDWKYDETDRALLWIRTGMHRDGIWQRCPVRLGGILWIVPS